jgi:RHS repeat-associated protein
MRRHLAPILALLVLAALPAAAHTRAALQLNKSLPSSLETEPEIALPAIVTEAEDRLEIFPANRKLASGIVCFVVEPNIWETRELGGKSWQGHDYMHARYFNPNFARFLSVDPVVTSNAVRNPQLWNRYAYVGNSPIGFIDPTGKELRLSGCAKDATSEVCKGQYNLYLSTFGKQAGDAAKHLTIGKNGVLKISGMTGQVFAAKFGLMGRATAYLVGNLSAQFTMNVGRNALTDQHRGGYADVNNQPPGGEFGVDPSQFPNSDHFFGLTVGATEALVHEIGHAVASLIPGHSDALALRKGRSLAAKANGRHETYATAFENAWRHEVLGATDIRSGYYSENDIYDSKSSEMFP